MMRGIIVLIFIYMASCSNSYLPEKIMRSQKKYFREQGYKKNEEIGHLRFLNQIRRLAFEKLEIDTKRYENYSTLYLIEAYDVASGDLNAVLMLNNEEYYYKSSLIEREIKFFQEPQIERKMINAYINRDYDNLVNPMRLGSNSYIGTTVRFNKNLEMSHLKW